MHIDGIFDEMFLETCLVDKVGNARILTCIYDKKGNLISDGFNKMKTHPFQKRFGTDDKRIFLHAEIDAIISALNAGIDIDQFKTCSMFVCRTKQNMKKTKWMTGLALPCLGCQKALAHFNFKNVFYTENEKEGFQCL